MNRTLATESAKTKMEAEFASLRNRISRELEEFSFTMDRLMFRDKDSFDCRTEFELILPIPRNNHSL